MTTTDKVPEGTPTRDDLIEVVIRVMPDAALVVDGSGRIVAANRVAERQFGYHEGTLVGTAVDALVPVRLRNSHERHRDTYLARPARRPMGAGLSLWAERRDGSEFPVDISLAPLGDDDRQLTLAAIRDMTLQRAEWESEARLATIVASSDDAIVSMDLAGTINSWNPSAGRLLGHEAAFMVGGSFWDLVPADRRAEAEQHMDQVRSGLRVDTYDTVRLHNDGHSIDVSETLSLIPSVTGEAAGFSAIIRDITQRRHDELELRRLLAESQRREHWLNAMSEVRLAIVGASNPQDWLDLITRRVSELIDIDGVLVALPDDENPDFLEVAAKRGEGLFLEERDLIPIDHTLAGRAFETGERVVSADFRSDSPAPPELIEKVDIGPVVIAPMTSSEGPRGVLFVSRLPDRPPFGEEEVDLVESFAQQAGLGMELAGAQTERAQFALIADRERIARDLHDHVIQRLFAVGMMLQSAAQSIVEERAQARIESSVEELDATIRDVRSTIFSLELRATEHVETSARSRLLDVASVAAPGLGFQPRLQFDGPIDTKLPEELVPDILAVVRETLSNTARHAEASTVEVHVTVDDDVLIEVTDDGKGAEGRTRSSGLANLRARAEARGGTMTVGQGRRGRGTRIEWQVPIGS